MSSDEQVVQHAISWPPKYLPGTRDNFVSNEVIVAGLSAVKIWRYIVDTSTWISYYDNVSDIAFPNDDGPTLANDVHFSFSTFGFPPLVAHVIEFQSPDSGAPGRLSWTAEQGDSPEELLDVLHAWLIEDLPQDRVRILTQESQIGVPARELAAQRPNPMLNGHQAWLDGLVSAARHSS
ncbi:hypothetical protein [Mycobacterium sp. OTB74]|uniref:hypothetical protein n=1 Tax=Mycobacterium sp. OTB74 TaxID=1853452 RepID=UPI002476451A|nr:hypothetical protein [Mycobacterium sp. OTB74]MDH6246499.1 hypothetical protein [Mycobacterium sp. OTB74]